MCALAKYCKHCARRQLVCVCVQFRRQRPRTHSHTIHRLHMHMPYDIHTQQHNNIRYAGKHEVHEFDKKVCV